MSLFAKDVDIPDNLRSWLISLLLRRVIRIDSLVIRASPNTRIDLSGLWATSQPPISANGFMVASRVQNVVGELRIDLQINESKWQAIPSRSIVGVVELLELLKTRSVEWGDIRIDMPRDCVVTLAGLQMTFDPALKVNGYSVEQLSVRSNRLYVNEDNLIGGELV